VTRPMLPALLTTGGGIFVLLTGLAVATPGAPASYLGLYVGGAALVVGLLIVLLPDARRLWGAVAIALAALSIPYTYGGLVVGAFLLVLGGSFAIVWVPAPPGRAAALRGAAARSRL